MASELENSQMDEFAKHTRMAKSRTQLNKIFDYFFISNRAHAGLYSHSIRSSKVHRNHTAPAHCTLQKEKRSQLLESKRTYLVDALLALAAIGMACVDNSRAAHCGVKYTSNLLPPNCTDLPLLIHHLNPCLLHSHLKVDLHLWWMRLFSSHILCFLLLLF